jgi:hypothetical protein
LPFLQAEKEKNEQRRLEALAAKSAAEAWPITELLCSSLITNTPYAALCCCILQAEKKERERRRLEALAAKRYPIDDLELLTEELTVLLLHLWLFHYAAGNGAGGTSRNVAVAAKRSILAASIRHCPASMHETHLLPATLCRFSCRLRRRSESGAAWRPLLPSATPSMT